MNLEIQLQSFPNDSVIYVEVNGKAYAAHDDKVTVEVTPGYNQMKFICYPDGKMKSKVKLASKKTPHIFSLKTDILSVYKEYKIFVKGKTPQMTFTYFTKATKDYFNNEMLLGDARVDLKGIEISAENEAFLFSKDVKRKYVFLQLLNLLFTFLPYYAIAIISTVDTVYDIIHPFEGDSFVYRSAFGRADVFLIIACVPALTFLTVMFVFYLVKLKKFVEKNSYK